MVNIVSDSPTIDSTAPIIVRICRASASGGEGCGALVFCVSKKNYSAVLIIQTSCSFVSDLASACMVRSVEVFSLEEGCP